MSRVIETEGKLFEIFLGQPREDSAVARVTWCIADQTWSLLRDSGVMRPHMLVMVMKRAPGKESGEGRALYSYDRFLVPLDAGFVQFQAFDPGKFEIYAAIVIARSGSRKGDREAYSGLMYRSGFDWRMSVTSYDYMTVDPNYWNWGYGSVLGYVDRVDWIVGEDLFAKEPSAALKWWVGLFFRSSPHDQCHFRRRTLLSIPLSIAFGPYLLLRWSAQLLLLLVGFLMGCRALKPKALLHPRDWSFMSVIEGMSDYQLWWKYRKDGTPIKECWKQAICFPVVWVGLLGISSAIAVNLLSAHFEPNLPAFLIGVVVILVMMVLGIALLSFLIVALDRLLPMGVRKSLENIGRPVKRFENWLEGRESRRFAEYYDKRLDPLVCTKGGPKVGSFDALPKSHRTVYTKFLNAKLKLCKPFRRGG